MYDDSSFWSGVAHRPIEKRTVQILLGAEQCSCRARSVAVRMLVPFVVHLPSEYLT
jgi:hypothetical protein